MPLLRGFARFVGARFGIALSLVVGAWLAPSPAMANGRFPEANQLIVDGEDARHLLVRTTFGILRSFDAGTTWTWTCEEAISPLGLLDEEILITTQGRTTVALTDGFATTDRQGCGWQRGTGDLAGQRVMDLVGDPVHRASAYAGVNITIGGSSHGRIARTTDGATWSFIGEVLPSTVPLTIEIAASRPERLYLGVNDGNFEFGFIDVSDDAGLTWTRHDAPRGVDSIYVSGVDPANPDRVYVRSTFPEHTLFVSEDGAKSWTAVYTATKPLTGFALSPDGHEVAVGGEDGMAILERAELGDGTSTFTATSAAMLNAKCLTWSSAGLFACANEGSDGFTIGLSIDRGQTFKPLLRLPDLVPGWCPEGTSVARSCAALWCGFAGTIGASCAPAVMPKPDGGLDAGGGGGGSGCGCQTAGTCSSPVVALFGATIVALLVACRGATRRRGFDGR